MAEGTPAIDTYVLDQSGPWEGTLPAWGSLYVDQADSPLRDALVSLGFTITLRGRGCALSGMRCAWKALSDGPGDETGSLSQVATNLFERYHRSMTATFPLAPGVDAGPGRTLVMGILNVTPDSFSDGGQFQNLERAVDHGLAMDEAGVHIIDVGGESTRPGAADVSVAEETDRVVPVIDSLAGRVRAALSVDTSKAQVARAALAAGAGLVNDVRGLTGDPDLAAAAADAGAGVVVMHMLGTPRTMQKEPAYDDLFGQVHGFLGDCVERAVAAGVDRDRVVVDPGIGFGKTVDHNLSLIRHLHRFRGLGCPILLGSSRKSFIGHVLDLPVEDRSEGTAATVAASILGGAHIVRVHDVAAMGRVARLTDALRQAEERPAP